MFLTIPPNPERFWTNRGQLSWRCLVVCHVPVGAERIIHKWIRLHLKCEGTRSETIFRLSAKRTSQFKSAGASVQSTAGSRVVRISGSNAGYTMFPGSVKGTGYPLHSPVSPSLHLPCVTVCHHISTRLYLPFLSSLSVCFEQNNELKPLSFPDRRILRMLPPAHCFMSLESGLLFKPCNIYYIVHYNIYYVQFYFTYVEIRFWSFLRNSLVIYIWKVLSSLEYRFSYSAACMVSAK